MYQGKFDAKARGQEAPDEALKQILEAREAAIAAKAAKVARLRNTAAQASRKPGAKPAAPGTPPGQRTAPARPGAPRPAAPNGARPPVPGSAPKAPAAKPAVPGQRPTAPGQKPAAVNQKPAAVSEKATARKQPMSHGSVVFYTAYALFIVLFLAATGLTMLWLKGWLVDFEAAQPTLKVQEVFDEHFKNPDWSALYDLSGTEGTAYEGKEQYVAYMEEKVAGQELNFVETSAGLSRDGTQQKKYIVRLDKEPLATFMLVSKTKITDIPDWQLGQVDLIFSRQQGYLIQKLDGHMAYINDVPLDDSFTIQIASTKAEQFLPIGTPGVRLCIQQINGLMAKPVVKIVNQTGEEMGVEYDEATGTFLEQTEATTMNEEQKEVAVGAMKARAEYMVKAAGSRTAVAKYYDTGSQAYNDLVEMAKELWMNEDNGHSFSEPVLTGYAKYSDDLFSVRGSIIMHMTLKDNTQRDYEVDMSMFFRKKNDKWVCYEFTNEDVTQPVGKVRLTFVSQGETLSSDFFETSATSLLTPVVSVPDGKVFSGWVREVYDENGRMSYDLMFEPDESGHVTLNVGSNLEPMTLYALFENAPQEAEEGGTN